MWTALSVLSVFAVYIAAVHFCNPDLWLCIIWCYNLLSQKERMVCWRRNWFRRCVFDSRPGCCSVTKNHRQVSHTVLPLSPSSIKRYQQKLGAKQALRAMHWPVSMDLQLQLVSGWGLQNGRSMPPYWPSLVAQEGLQLFFNLHFTSVTCCLSIILTYLLFYHHHHHL